MNQLKFFNLHLNRFLGEMVPIIPIIGLLFLDKGISLSEISLFFLSLSAAILIFEIPSGMVADKIGHRFILILSRAFKLLGFVILFFAQDVWVFVLAALVWGIASAFDSGAVQAYTYELAKQNGLEKKFEKIYGRNFTAATLGLLLAVIISTQVTNVGFQGLQYFGIISLSLCFLTSLFLPRVKIQHVNTNVNGQKLFSYIFSLRSVLILLLSIGIFSGGIKGSLDEYTSILLADKNTSYAMIGYIIFGLELLRTVGAALSSRFDLSLPGQIKILGVLGLAFIVAAFSNIFFTFISLVIVLFIDAILWVHNDTLIQRHSSDENRATVASIKNFGTEFFAATIFLMAWFFGKNWEVDVLYLSGGALLIFVSIAMSIKYKTINKP